MQIFLLSENGSGKRLAKDLREKKVPLGEYLAFLSVKYSVDSDKLFQTLISTKERQKNRCGEISVECRGKVGNERIFLMTQGSTVIAQLKVSEKFLLDRVNPLKKFMDTARIRKYIGRKNKVFQSNFIKDLRVGMRNVNLNAMVLEIPEPTYVYTRFGNSAVVTNALIGDATGTIKLCLWNDQISGISVGDNIQIRNARTFAFRGEKQLRVGNKGSLRVQQEGIIEA